MLITGKCHCGNIALELDWEGDPPDPHDETTFNRSKLTREEQPGVRDLYRELLRLRRETPSLRSLDLDAVETQADDERRMLIVTRGETCLVFNFSDREQVIELPSEGEWTVMIESGVQLVGNQIAMQPESFSLFLRLSA